MKRTKENLFKKFSIALAVAISLTFSVPLLTIAKPTENNIENRGAVPVEKQTLVFDHYNHNNMPANFRKSNDQISQPGINTTGLENLNISGSEQYSSMNLKLLKAKLPKNLPLTFVDLRQESHGFINGLPISWEGNGNKANMGLSESQVIALNNQQLANIKIDSNVTIGNKTLMVKEVYSEETLIKANEDNYIRVTATDTKVPTAINVDSFLDQIEDSAEDSWFHFHCKEGIGRTTTFMTLYDIMKNSKTVPLEDIVNRQIVLANLQSKDNSLKSAERMELYNNFYNYIKSGESNKTFSEFVAK
ncbi:MAG: fused DSP-PTPase phosphatase/NAD kinase-like protein [Sarcina sp.]